MADLQQADEQNKSLGIQDIEPLPLPSSGSALDRATEEEKLLYRDPKVRHQEAEVAKLEESVEVLKQDRQERQKYAKKLFYLICLWLVGVYSLILFNGFSKTKIYIDTKGVPIVEKVTFIPKFELSDTVLLAMIGGTTINVLGLFVIVANYLFNSQKHQNKEDKKVNKEDAKY